MRKSRNIRSLLKLRGKRKLKIDARIENLKYETSLCQQLKSVDIDEFVSGTAFRNGAFLLSYSNNIFAISHWVSPKRTRTYPYARVYDTMASQRRVTIIPFLKDEGKEGDRDFVQWDSISLMSLLGVYVILGYYRKAKRSPKYEHKITGQKKFFQ